MRTPLNTLWVEGKLSWLEAACLASAVRNGHLVTLWTYGGVTGVPDGVEVADAADVMAPDRLVKHRKKESWAVGADLFRIELQRQGRGAWIDADVYLLKPLSIDPARVLFGLSKPGLINNAVLYIPCDHPYLGALEAYLAQRHLVPWWLPRWKRLPYELRAKLGLPPLPLSRHIWGITGPRALTFVAREHGLMDEALPPEVFYPYGPKEAHLAFGPAAEVHARLGERTVAVHLWNGQVRPQKAMPPPEGSFAAEMCAREGISP